MKTNHFSKYVGGVLLALCCAALTVHAQQRGGGGGGFGGGGFGGFGGFGGGGFGGGNNANRGTTTAGQYNNNGSVGSAVITVDPQTHNIVVIADAETSRQISNVLANLDIPKPQVLIKVIFVEVARDSGLDFGVEGAYTANHLGNSGNIKGSAADVFGLAGANSVVSNFNGMGQAFSSSLTPNSKNNGFYQIVGTDFQATVKAIATAGKAQIISRPSILARDGQLAKIVVGQQVYLPSGVSFTSSGLTTVPIINGSYTSVGIILNVTPFIGENGLVEMILQPQTSQVDTSTPGQQIASGGILGSPVFAPTLNVRSADTVIVTPDGQTVVIGGLIDNTKSTADSKIPILGDIPILGHLFKSSSKTEKKKELMMFLTPHIVQSPMQLAALTANETRQSQVITNTFNEQELNRILDRVPVKKN